MKIFLPFFLIIIFSASLSGEFMWPIDTPKRVTGTHGEYRGSSFHHGIDIGTYGKTGYRIFAAESGYVSAVMYQHWGIGYAVFVKHPGGLTTFYGHMERFSDFILKNSKIKSKYDNILNRTDFRIDFDEPEIKVTKGTLLGYSGESGIGPEHLHFEIRDGDNHYLNPLKNGISVGDVIPPVIRKLYIVPLDPFSHVDGYSSVAEHTIVPDNKKKGTYVLKSGLEPSVGGRIGLKINAHDFIGSRNAVAPYRISLYVNNKFKYDFSFDKMERSENSRIGLYYDYDYTSFSDYTFYLYSRIDDSGVINSDGKNDGIDVKIICYDAANNSSSLEFRLKQSGRLDKAAYEYEANLHPGKKFNATSKDKSFNIIFGKESAFYSEMVELETDNDFDIHVMNLGIKSRAYSVSPTNLCLNKPAEIRIKYDGEDYKKVGIYKKSKGSFYFISNSYNSDDKYFFAKIGRMGTYFLVIDESPPVIRFKNNIKRKINKSIIINASDTGTGIDLSSVEILVDGSKVIWSWEIDKHYLEILPHNKIWGKGKHKIDVHLMDRVGNRTSGTYYYLI